jgi:hypothetical protein
MPTDDITRKLSGRYACAVSTGERMCCPTVYDFDGLQSCIPDEVLRISYGCGTPAGLATIRSCETVFSVSNMTFHRRSAAAMPAEDGIDLAAYGPALRLITAHPKQ